MYCNILIFRRGLNADTSASGRISETTILVRVTVDTFGTSLYTWIILFQNIVATSMIENAINMCGRPRKNDIDTAISSGINTHSLYPNIAKKETSR